MTKGRPTKYDNMSKKKNPNSTKPPKKGSFTKAIDKNMKNISKMTRTRRGI